MSLWQIDSGGDIPYPLLGHRCYRCEKVVIPDHAICATATTNDGTPTGDVHWFCSALCTEDWLVDEPGDSEVLPRDLLG